MKQTQVTLVDLGLDDSFDTSMTFIQATIQNINAGMVNPAADISFIRTRHIATIFDTMLSQCDVLHVMAHGDKTEDPAFVSSDGQTTFDFGNLKAHAFATGNGLRAHTIIADACSTATGKWKRAVRSCLEHDITYIGTSRQIGWHDSTVFCSAFYGALFKRRGKGLSPAEHSYEAATRAVTAFETITGAESPFRVVVLTPNRDAKRYVVDVT
jgi:hypothetical protein